MVSHEDQVLAATNKMNKLKPPRKRRHRVPPLNSKKTVIMLPVEISWKPIRQAMLNYVDNDMILLEEGDWYKWRMLHGRQRLLPVHEETLSELNLACLLRLSSTKPIELSLKGMLLLSQWRLEHGTTAESLRV